MVRVVMKEGGLGAGGGWELPQRHGRLQNDNEAITRARKCLLLWRISILGGAFEQDIASSEEKKRIKRGGGRRRAEMSWSYGMDGQKDIEMILVGW